MQFKTYKERNQEKLDNMRKQIEDESVPLYKREQLVSKVWFLKNKLHPRIFWNSSDLGTYRKPINRKAN